MTRTFWITGSSSGLGLALVQQLLQQGHQVAASTSTPDTLQALEAQYPDHLLVLPGDLAQSAGADAAVEAIRQRWEKLDTLVINAGSADYLAKDVDPPRLFEALVNSNRLAGELSLCSALPLLARGEAPRVVAILSPYSALQLHEPTQPLSGRNSLAHWFREQRPVLAQFGIGLTVTAPYAPKAPMTAVAALPEAWTAEAAAAAILGELRMPQEELVLEALTTAALWPLPE